MKKLNSLLNDNKNTYEQNKKDINNNEIQKIKEFESKNQVRYKNNKKSYLDTINNIKNKSSSQKNERENEIEGNDEDAVYIGARNFQGKKQGFGIQIYPSGDKFKGIFSNDRASGWGIFEHKDGEKQLKTDNFQNN